MATIRLAHLTDLHCDGTSAWTTNFGYIKSCLVAERPNIVVITGDCVDHPKNKLFNLFAESVQDLCAALSKRDTGNFYLVTVPGNHDRFMFGNKVPTIPFPFAQRKHENFDRFLPRLLYPRQDGGLDSLIKSIFDEYQIAVFPIDSTNPGSPLAFAQGRVNEPFQLLERQKANFVKWAGVDEVRYSSSVKIILLHHHVVPLPAEKIDERLEPFNLIRNPFQFLHAATEHKIDLVLHGHRHVSGISQLQMLSHGGHPITISACGSSCKSNLGKPCELKIIEFSESRAAAITVFTTEEGLSVFRKKQKFPIFSYAARRDTFNHDVNRYEKQFISVVDRVEKRTKLIKIEYNNICEISNSFLGIKWNSEVKGLSFSDTIISEAGRVVRVKTQLSDILRLNSGKWHSRAEVTDSPPEPHAEERIDLTVTPDRALDTNAFAYCSVKALLHNVYALTTTEFEECYPVQGSIREETSSIMMRYPTDEAEVILKFPGPDRFPDPNSFHVEAYQYQPADDANDRWNTLARRYVTWLHDEETLFLKDMGALRVRPELNEVILTIPYPQPGIRYTVRWSVVDDREMDDPVILYQAKQLAKRFLNGRDEGPHKFYRDVCHSLGTIFDTETFDIVLSAADFDERKLQVMGGPYEYIGKTMQIGRGVAGTAFKLRKAESYINGIRNSYMEPFFVPFDPEAILSLPLLYPRISGNRPRGDVRDHPFAVLSIITRKKDSPLSAFITREREIALDRVQGRTGRGDSQQEGVLGALYKLIEAPFVECFGKEPASWPLAGAKVP